MFVSFPFFPLENVGHVLDVFKRQFTPRGMPGILILPSLEIAEILRPGKQCALADFTVGRQTLHLHFDPSHHLMHEPVWYAEALLGINKPEQNHVTEQHAPVSAEAE